ncbi:MAG: phosphatidylglycerophosphatase A, partial [Desulfobacula sp.]|nr:phosphatidylglycerophosphatase A [Desulfobacula sp.]
KDPGCIVIDEIAGYVVTMSIVPVNIYTIGAGFFIFRFFDIVKFGPVKYFEENFSGGAGVVLDDIMAGIFSAVVLRILYLSGIF